MLKTNLLVFTCGIIIGGILQYLSLNTTNEEIMALSSSLEPKLSRISQQLSNSRRLSQGVKPATKTEPCIESESWDNRITDLKQSIEWTLKTSLKSGIQDELEPVVRHLIKDKQLATQLNLVADPALTIENMVKAEQILTMAIGDGVWTQQNMDAYNDTLHYLPIEAQAEALRQLMSAVNHGKIVIDKGVFLF
jgi:hypothetical protein